MGYVGRNRAAEFVQHVRRLEQGLTSVENYGKLTFSNREVFSYHLRIGYIHLEDKVIVYYGEPNTKTTNMHIGAISRADYRMPDYLFLAVEGNHILDSIEEHVMRWGAKNPTKAEARDCIAFYRFLQDCYGFYLCESKKRIRDNYIREYAQSDQRHRENMRGLLEMAREGET